MDKKVRIGLVGSQFISTIHAEALQHVADAEIVAVMSPTAGNAETFARQHDIPNYFSDLDEMLASADCVVIVTNHSEYDYAQIVEHAPLVIDTRNATAHVQHGREKIVLA